MNGSREGFTFEGAIRSGGDCGPLSCSRVLPHMEIALLLPGALVYLGEPRNTNFYMKFPFKNICLNKNSKKKKALCRQNTSVRQMSRSEPQATRS